MSSINVNINGSDENDANAESNMIINTTKTANDSLLSDFFKTNNNIPAFDCAPFTNDANDHKKRTNQFNNSMKPKKKRRVFSCDVCRKLKTKCVYNSDSIFCERCSRLKIPCILPGKLIKPKTNAEAKAIKNINKFDSPAVSFLAQAEDSIIGNQNKPEDTKMEDKIQNMESLIMSLTGKMDSFVSYFQKQVHLKTSNFSSATQLSNFSDLAEMIPQRHDFSAPLNLIERIHTTLFPEPTILKINTFTAATQKFVQFYLKNEHLCLELAKQFLEVFHFWIIPGGISIIDKDYVIAHPFITCVFVLIAMTVEKKYRHSALQSTVYQLLQDIVASTEGKGPLSDHDVEALLYVCMYNIEGFDGWILSNVGLMHYVMSVDLKNIIQRVVDENVYEDDDLFHLRIFNSLCACHLQNAIGTGKPVMVPDYWWRVYRLTIVFPNATIGDAIKVAELDLYRLLASDLMEGATYFEKNSCMEVIVDGSDLLVFPDLIDWKNRWERIIAKDVSQVLTYSFNFSYILLSRKFIDVICKALLDYELGIAYNTACQYSFEILNQLLNLSSEFVKGTPVYQLNQIVYACITLFEYLGYMKDEEKRMSLNLISKTYWHLNKMGQELSDATETIAKIIKKLVEIANKNQVLHLTPTYDKGFVGSGSITKTSMYKARKDSQQQQKLSLDDLPVYTDSGNANSTQSSPAISSTPPKISGGRSNSGDAINTTTSMNRRRSSMFTMQNSPNLKTTKDRKPVTASNVNTNSGNSNHNNNTSNNNHAVFADDDVQNFQLPDLSNFKNFEEFFSDLFNDL